MTSDYRRDHILDVKNDEYERLGTAARGHINNVVAILEGFYEEPPASAGETKALKRACARYLIDSGKASLAGEV
jgi:hypothetical protein